MWPIRAQEPVINIVLPAFSNSAFDRSFSMAESPKKVLQGDLCFICSTSVQKKRNIYIFGRSSFDFSAIISSCLDVNASSAATSELSVCKACYRRLIKFKFSSSWRAQIWTEGDLQGLLTSQKEALIERWKRQWRNPSFVPWEILEMFVYSTIRSITLVLLPRSANRYVIILWQDFLLVLLVCLLFEVIHTDLCYKLSLVIWQ